MSRALEFDKQEMLEKAMNLFWEKGYNATSAQDIVSTLGINRSSMYNTFGDKHNLFASSLELYQDHNAAAMVLLVENTSDPMATIAHMFTSLVSEVPNDPLSRGCFVVNTAVELAPHDAHIKDIVLANMQFSENIFLLLLEKAQLQGQVASATNVVALSRFLANSVNGLRIAARAGISKESVADVIAVTLTAVK